MSKSARDIAFEVLVEHRDGGRLVSELLDRRFGADNRDDVRLASEIVYSTIRRQRTIDTILAAWVKRPREQVEQDLWTLLQIGACQIVLMETAGHAAVHETVETARRLGNPRWTGFLNGTLRAIARSVVDTPLVDHPAPHHVPLAGDTYRVMDRDLFPDFEADPIGYVERAFSFPRWLASRWLDRMSRADVLARAAFYNSTPRLTLRTNVIRTDRVTLLESLNQAGIAAAESDGHPDAIVLERRTAVTALPGFDEGNFAVQDESAMAASTLLNPKPGERVLDLCAGSGSKTCHLAALMQNRGRIVAVDSSTDRLALLQQNAERLGIGIVTPVQADATCPSVAAEEFDAVLVDVPCSNTGVLGKRAEVRWRLHPEELPELVQLQLKLLEAAVNAARVGGRIVYSTCSGEPDENELLVNAFIRLRADVALEAEQHHVPGQPGDGAYQALLTRREPH